LNNLIFDEGAFVQSDVLTYFDKAINDKLKFSSIVLDPPSFSRNKKGHFSAKDSFNELIYKSLQLLEANGTILVSSNNSSMSHAFFHSCLTQAATDAGRKVLAFNKVAQGRDFVGSGKARESSLCGLLGWLD
jgi:23S rRNA (cytosine1962-C5)-methyltransferase